jgi:hypothetical protein
MKIDSGKPSTGPRLTLDLSRHCIQTATRRCYEQRMAQYFRSEASRNALGQEIDLLQRALETLDFAALRSRWPALAGGMPVSIIMKAVGERIEIELEGVTITAPLRQGILSPRSGS